MGKGIGTFLLVIFLLWMVAPRQTESAITSVLTAFSNRISASATQSSTTQR